ncbi:MAG TPA: hypothetical protein PLC80_08975 [Draconibacterium sp.]|nr:hypothetical protein [Draconibacterium sp.]
MKKLCFLFLSAIFVFPVFAQPQKGYVYLKNGTILKGKYQYSNDSSKLQIESAGNLWIFQSDEVERVSNKKAQLDETFGEPNTHSRFFLHSELGVLAGNSENSQSAPFSFSASLNYSIIPKLSAGAGIGFEFLKETYLPAFVNIEYKLRNSYSTPYLFLKTGYEIPLEDANPVYNYEIQPFYYDYMIWPNPGYSSNEMDTKGGFMINPGIGYHRMFSSGFGMSLAFGYQFHRLSYTGENDYQLDIDYNRLTIKLGFIFN